MGPRSCKYFFFLEFHFFLEKLSLSFAVVVQLAMHVIVVDVLQFWTTSDKLKITFLEYTRLPKAASNFFFFNCHFFLFALKKLSHSSSSYNWLIVAYVLCVAYIVAYVLQILHFVDKLRITFLGEAASIFFFLNCLFFFFLKNLSLSSQSSNNWRNT